MNTRKSLRRILLLGYASIFAMAGTFGAWATMANLNGAVIAPATIVVESYSKRVQHASGGVVEKILVRDGDFVKFGQDLVLLDPTDAKAELAILDGLLEEMLVKRARLEAQRDGLTVITLPEEIKAKQTDPRIAEILASQTKLLVSSDGSERGKVDQLKQQVSQLEQEIKGLEGQAVSKKTQLALIADELENLRKLKKQGLVPNSRVLAVEREEARLIGEQAALVSAKAAAESKIGEVKLRIIQIEDDRRTQALTELRDTEARILEMRERRIATASKLTRTSIKAPITGTIYQMAIHTEGGVIGPGETIMLIVPEGDDLVLQAQVSPNDIDQVVQGQPARVRFPSFNANITPEVNAVVTKVAADTSRVDANSAPFYDVRITISVEELARLGNNKLKPGMTAEVFIQTEARTPLTYLVRPFLDQLEHAMR